MTGGILLTGEKMVDKKTDSKLTIIKRDGRKVEYDGNRIINVATRAMSDVGDIDSNIAKKIESEIYQEVTSGIHQVLFTVDNISDMVEDKLLSHEMISAAKSFIKYRAVKDEKRSVDSNSDENVKKYVNLTDEFVSAYKHLPNPFKHPMSEIIFYRTYSRFLKERQRREYWWETVRRAVEYNTTIVDTNKDESEDLFDLIYNLKGFLSGRTMYSGNTVISKNYPMSNFNCSTQVTNKLITFTQGFYLLLLGCGYGFRVFEDDIKQLPKFRTDIELIHQQYSPIPRGSRKEHTDLNFHGSTIAEIVVGDSKVGWVKAMEHYLNLLTDPMYFTVNTITINYNNVRPFGEKLITFGGKASGHTALEKMFNKIQNVIERRGSAEKSKSIKLTSVDCLDIHTSIAEGVVVGGTRRSAEIGLGSIDDDAFIAAKSNLYTRDEYGNWNANLDIINRQMSNNTILYYSKPSREKFSEMFEKVKLSGEPALYNAEQALIRNPYFDGTNACGEILLSSAQMCNLVTIAISEFVYNGVLNKKELFEAYRLITRANLRMSCVELELHEWNMNQVRDMLLGVSMTGYQDMVNLTNMNMKEQAELLRELRNLVANVADSYAEELGVNKPLLKTCVKPEGTISQLPLVSSGVHFSHSPYYTRRVRMNAIEPLTKVCSDLGYPIYNEVGQTDENCTTKVVEFPVKSPDGLTKYGVSAIEQLEIYKMFMENYVDHNASITVHVRPNEWKEVEQWVWDNWDSVIGISFISLDDSFYELLPYEAIDKEEYERRLANMKEFKPELITEYEKEEFEADMSLNSGCEGGSCPVR